MFARLTHPMLCAGLATILSLADTAHAAPAGRGDPPREEVRIASEMGVVLAGTLQKPRGRTRRPLPIVITIAGTGPWTRGGFPAIRQRLLERGIATLEYDKRGLGGSTGAFVDTLPAVERDVAAAVAFLRTRPDIDATRIALVGLSQGAVAAPAVAAHDPGIAAIVMLSGPIGQRGEVFLGIMRANLTAAGKSEAGIGKVIAATGRWMDARSRATDAGETALARSRLVASFVADTGFTPAQAEASVTTLDTPVVLSMYRTDPASALAAMRAPVLVVYGTADDLIAPALHAPAAAAALARNRDAMIVTIPGVDHGLARHGANGGATAPADPMAGTVVDLVGDWLGARLRPAPRRPAP